MAQKPLKPQLQLYLAQDRCGWLDASGVAHWDEEGDFDSRLVRCVEAAAKAWPRRGLRRTPVQVWVSGGLCRPFLLGPVAGLKGADEVRSFAQSQVADATGWDQPCEVRFEGDVTKGVVLATAMPTAVHARIEAVMAGAQLRLVSLRPWWAGALNQALQQQADLKMVVIDEPESLALLAGQGDDWDLADVFAPRPSADEAIRTVHRLSAGGSVQPEQSAWLRLGAGSAGALWPAAEPVQFGGQA